MPNDFAFFTGKEQVAFYAQETTPGIAVLPTSTLGKTTGGDMSRVSNLEEFFPIGADKRVSAKYNRLEAEFSIDMPVQRASVLNLATLRDQTQDAIARRLRSTTVDLGVVSTDTDVNAWRFVGCKANTLRLDINADGFLTASMGFMALNRIAPAASPGFPSTQQTYPTTPAPEYFAYELKLTLETEDYKLATASVDINNNLRRIYVANATVPTGYNLAVRGPRTLREGRQVITLSTTTYERPALNLEADYITPTATATLVFTDATESLSPRILTITLNDLHCTRIGQPIVDVDGDVIYTYEFSAVSPAADVVFTESGF